MLINDVLNQSMDLIDNVPLDHHWSKLIDDVPELCLRNTGVMETELKQPEKILRRLDLDNGLQCIEKMYSKWLLLLAFHQIIQSIQIYLM